MEQDRIQKPKERDKLSDLAQLCSLTAQLFSAADLLGIHPYNGPPQGDLFQAVDDLSDRIYAMGLGGLKGLGAQLRGINELREKMAAQASNPQVKVSENGVVTIDDGSTVISGVVSANGGVSIDTGQGVGPAIDAQQYPLPENYDPVIDDGLRVMRGLE